MSVSKIDELEGVTHKLFKLLTKELTLMNQFGQVWDACFDGKQTNIVSSRLESLYAKIGMFVEKGNPFIGVGRCRANEVDEFDCKRCLKYNACYTYMHIINVLKTINSFITGVLWGWGDDY